MLNNFFIKHLHIIYYILTFAPHFKSTPRLSIWVGKTRQASFLKIFHEKAFEMN